MMHSKNTATVSNRVVQEFKKWQKTYNKSFSDPEFETYRLNVFAQNLKKIESHPEEATYKLGQNQFMDLTHTAFKNYYLGLLDAPQKKTGNYFATDDVSVPANVDWRKEGKVSPVKDQGQCGSCWAFSTTGSLEAVGAIQGSGLESFSEQQLVDCSTTEGN